MRGWVFLSLLGIGLGLGAVAAWQKHRQAQEEAVLARIARGEPPPQNAAPRLRLAWANYLLGRGRYEEALTVFSGLLEQPESALSPWVHYNLGNLYLRRALVAVQEGRFDEAFPLVELAKQSYREALHLQPELWPAKYNLEAALRLLPEIAELPARAKESQDGRELPLATQVPGFPRGLP